MDLPSSKLDLKSHKAAICCPLTALCAIVGDVPNSVALNKKTEKRIMLFQSFFLGSNVCPHCAIGMQLVRSIIKAFRPSKCQILSTHAPAFEPSEGTLADTHAFGEFRLLRSVLVWINLNGPLKTLLSIAQPYFRSASMRRKKSSVDQSRSVTSILGK
jgi:hypothetical protein